MQRARLSTRARGYSLALLALALSGIVAFLVLHAARNEGGEREATAGARDEPARPAIEPGASSARAPVPVREPVETGADAAHAPVEREDFAGEAPEAPQTSFGARVVDDGSGAPLAGARVRPVGESEGSRGRKVLTDGSGAFRWEVRAPPEELEVRAEDYAPRFLWARADATAGAAPVEVRLLRAAALVAQLAGAPAPGTLRLRVSTPRGFLHDRAQDRDLAPDVVLEAAFDADGRAELAGLVPRAPLALEVQGPAGLLLRVAEPLVLEPEESRAVELDLAAGMRVPVRCLDQRGTPVAGLELLLTRAPQNPVEEKDACYFHGGDLAAGFARQRTNESGRAAFPDVPPGIWWIGPAPPGLEELDSPREPDEAVPPLATRFELAPRTGEHELVLRLERGLYLRGRLIDSAGNAVSRAFVGAEHETLGGFVTGDVGPDGTFSLGPVAPGVHRLRALPHGVYLEPEPVRCEPDGSEVVIELVPGGKLAGLVVDASTGAPARADVVCSRPGAAFDPHGSFGDDGRFEFSGLAAGTYAVAAHTQDGRAGLVQALELAAGAARSDLRIELHEAARLALRRTGGPERVEFVLRIGAAVVGRGPLDRGVDQHWFVPAARVSVTLVAHDSVLGEREVEARPGATNEAFFELE